MALQRINWTQIDTLNIPSGYTVDIGTITSPIHSVNTTNLSIEGIDFFTYLAGYTGFTPTQVKVEDNAGLGVVSGNTLYTTYNTTLDPALSTPSTVGGITAGTTVAQLSGKTFVEFVDELLFPIVLPTYTIPTITMTGIVSDTREILSPYITNINLYGTKNDAGPFTQLRILRNGSSIFTNIALTQSSAASIPNQFGYVDPNNPNYTYTINPTPYAESYIIPYPIGANVSSLTTYQADGNYGFGLPKKDNKGNTDGRASAVRSTDNPQSGSNNFATSTLNITGLYPYFWGTSVTLPTTASIASVINSGGSNKVLSSASGTLSIPYNMPSGTYLYIWVAYFNQYTTKTVWYVNALDNGNIDNSFIKTASIQAVNSPDGYWSGINFKMHWSVYPTQQNASFEFRNS